MLSSQNHCPLCKGESSAISSQEFRKCSGCQSIFRSPGTLLTLDQEFSRYQKHNNDIHDIGYQGFVLPLVEQVVHNHNTQKAGLDYGAGPGPVVAHMLKERGYLMSLYDPFFHPHEAVLQKEYDYIIASEVIEHFHKPYDEFQKLFHLLKKGGKLYIMTHIYDESIDFETWYYKNDPTHVFFYHPIALKWIKKEYGFKNYSQNKRLIIFKK